MSTSQTKGRKYTDYLRERLRNYRQQLRELASLQRLKPGDDELALDIQELDAHAANVDTLWRSKLYHSNRPEWAAQRKWLSR